MRAVRCCALPRSRAVYARVCCEKKALARVVAFTRSAVPHCSRLLAVPYARQYYGAPLCQSSRMEGQKALCAPALRRSELAACKTLARKNRRVNDFTLKPCATQPKQAGARTRAQEATKPALVVEKLAALVLSVASHRLYARHDAARSPERPARAVLASSQKRRPLRRRNRGLPRRQRLPERRRRVKR